MPGMEMMARGVTRYYIDDREVTREEYEAHFNALPNRGYGVYHHGAWNARNDEVAGLITKQEADARVEAARLKRRQARSRSRQR